MFDAAPAELVGQSESRQPGPYDSDHVTGPTYRWTCSAVQGFAMNERGLPIGLQRQLLEVSDEVQGLPIAVEPRVVGPDADAFPTELCPHRGDVEESQSVESWGMIGAGTSPGSAHASLLSARLRQPGSFG